MLATLATVVVMPRLAEGETPPFVAAGGLTGRAPADAPARLAAVVHYVAGGLTGALFVWLLLLVESPTGVTDDRTKRPPDRPPGRRQDSRRPSWLLITLPTRSLVQPPETTVRAVMTAPVKTVDGQSTAREAARLLADESVGSVIVDGMFEEGILTKTDLVTGMGHGVDPDATPVAALMSSPVVTVSPDAELREAVDRMETNGIKRLAVEADGEIVGVVTTTDLVGELAPDLDAMVEMFADAD